jgi:uncharacterized protein YxjI
MDGSLGNKYHVYNEAQQPLVFVDRPVMKIKRVFGVYEDETKARQLFTLEQASAWSIINFEFTLTDAAGQPIARLRRHGWASMVRRTWKIYDPGGREIAHAYEDSLWKAVVRRALELSDSLGGLIRTNFIIVRPDGSRIGEFVRRFTLTDKYVLDLTPDSQRSFDRRIAVALAILLDNAESR